MCAGFDFATLPKGAKVVDVGGGVGTISLAITKAFPHLHVVVQDQKPVIDGEAQALWAKEDQKAVEDGRVTLQAHDFFQPQPVKDAAVFFMRFVVHDWADAQSIEILKHLREAATPETKLILAEELVQPLCPANEIAIDVPGASLPLAAAAPAPLLPTDGSAMTYFGDLVSPLPQQGRRHSS